MAETLRCPKCGHPDYEIFPEHGGGICPGCDAKQIDESDLAWLRAAHAEACQVAAARVGGDPALRDLLLQEFGTTDPELLKVEIAALRDNH